MHSHFKTPQRSENSSYHGFGSDRCTSKVSFRPGQRVTCPVAILTGAWVGHDPPRFLLGPRLAPPVLS